MHNFRSHLALHKYYFIFMQGYTYIIRRTKAGINSMFKPCVLVFTAEWLDK